MISGETQTFRPYQAPTMCQVTLLDTEDMAEKKKNKKTKKKPCSWRPHPSKRESSPLQPAAGRLCLFPLARPPAGSSRRSPASHHATLFSASGGSPAPASLLFTLLWLQELSLLSLAFLGSAACRMRVLLPLPFPAGCGLSPLRWCLSLNPTCIRRGKSAWSQQAHRGQALKLVPLI